jgi:transcriptional regulator with XRE-family HTH domain
MSKAGDALKQVLETHNISRYKLAQVMGISRSNLHRWVYGVADPAGDSILEIRDALRNLHPEAAEEFKRLYWDEAIEDQE